MKVMNTSISLKASPGLRSLIAICGAALAITIVICGVSLASSGAISVD